MLKERDYRNIDYLRFGNERQVLAYKELIELNIFERLKKFNPILAGTIPIEIDLPDSDLDIICECDNQAELSKILIKYFSGEKAFELKLYERNGIDTIRVRFNTENFMVEIFGQNIPTQEQNAYRHMLIEDKIIREKGLEFKSKIIELKSKGFKTEPAFAILLGLKGNPYEELLKIKID